MLQNMLQNFARSAYFYLEHAVFYANKGFTDH